MFESVFEFIGDTDAGLGYIHGREYTLVVNRRTFMQRVMGTLAGIPYDWEIIIRYPFMCPYSNMDKFRENWKLTGLRLTI